MKIFKEGEYIMSNTKQLVEIKQAACLEKLINIMSAEIDKKIEAVTGLVYENSENSLSETKKIRAELNKELTKFENVRKNIKNTIMKPYMEFEKLYKDKIANKYNKATEFFKEKIETMEGQIKDSRKNKLQEYFEEYCTAQNINCISFEDMGLKINISGSDKSYRDKIKKWIDKVKQDLAVINTAKDEQTRLAILVDYKKDFNVNRAILDHDKLIREMKELKSKKDISNNTELENPVVSVDNTVYTMTFTVSGTIDKLKALKTYLKDNELI